MMKQCLCLFSLTLLVSCKPDVEQGSLPVIDIENNINSFEFVNLSEIADSIEYIPLETDDNSLMSYNRSLKITDDRYILIDSYSCKSFTKKGKYICSYGSKGKGPGQFMYVQQVSIHKELNSLYIYERGKFMEYSLDSGIYKHDIQVPKALLRTIGAIPSFFSFGDSIFCSSSPGDYNEQFSLILFNAKGKILATYPNYFNDPSLFKDKAAYLNLNYPLLSSGNRILYKNGLCDTAFYLNTNLEREPAYIFNFGKYCNKPVEFLKSLPSTSHIPFYFNKEVYNFISINFLKEINDMLLFTCLFRSHLPKSEKSFPVNTELHNSNGPFTVVETNLEYNTNNINSMFNAKTSKLVFLKKTDQYAKDAGGFSGFVNDIDGGVPFWPSRVFENQLIMVVEAYDLKDYIRSDSFTNSQPKYPEKKEALQRLADRLNYDDNPVIMVVHLKNEK